MKSAAGIVMGLALLCVSIAAYAFKVDTHVWVGQQVINDLADDGELSIKIGDTTVNLKVRDDVKNAILANKSAYLMGNLGPDAGPDVVVGQTVVHPGVKNDEGENIGWQTNDWLDYLLSASANSDVGTAYTYGYLAHAAADVFAHTYVNQYAGDIFDLKDETLVEQRHFILESYIGKHTPPLKNHLGKSLGAPWTQVEMGDTLAEFIRDTLIYNDQVQQEYWKVPTAKHLAAYYQYRKAIDAVAEDGIWHEIDIAITKIVAAYYGIDLNSDEAGEVVDAAQKVADEINRGSEKIQKFTNKMYDEAAKFDEKVFKRVSSAKNKMEQAEKDWLAKHQEWRRKLLDLKNLPDCPKLEVCVHSPTIKEPARVKCDDVVDRVCESRRKEIQGFNNVILEAADSLENEALGLKDDLLQATFDLRRETLTAIDSVHAIKNGLEDLKQLISSDVSPVQALLRGWRDDLDVAMTAYVKAANQAMINTMNPDESATDPIFEWFDCYHLSIIGVPSSISGCEFRGGVQGLMDSLDNILAIFDGAATVGDIPNISKLKNLHDKLIDKLVDELKESVAEQITDMLPDEVKEILELLDLEVDDKVLKHYFNKAETIAQPKGLIMISDMAERVKAEMHLIKQEKTEEAEIFDAQKYAVAYNAVVLAKLALLDNYGFEELALLSGASDHVNYFGVKNIVATAFGNIDGNHQWMPLPPPIPNAFNRYEAVDYTYSSDRSALGEHDDLGFVPWKGDMRSNVFRNIFIGPISPGIDAPSVIGKSRIVGSEYPYQPCAAQPFPDDVNDRTCVTVYLIPIISVLLN